MSNEDIKLFVSIGSIAVNLFMMVIMQRVKIEIAQIKVWILENFERRDTR